MSRSPREYLRGAPLASPVPARSLHRRKLQLNCEQHAFRQTRKNGPLSDDP